MARFYNDPLGFVMYAYPWDTDPSIQLVELEAPWSLIYDSKYGPDAWACELLEEIGRDVTARGFDGINAVAPIQHAISSGHGIGKTAFAAWITDWIMSTRPHSKGVITANTAEQLSTKTWAGIATWTAKCITGHWFKITTGKGAMRMAHKQHPDSWRVDAQTSREENSESFAGLHAANSTPWYLFDEASAVPKVIWDVAEGGKTDGEPMHFAFGNPTRTTGGFADCFGKQRHRWKCKHIDSRSVKITNKEKIAEWVRDYGEDSDFVKVRVRGVFPNASSEQFVPRGSVDGAMARPAGDSTHVGMVAAVGVDVARFGDDSSCIATRVARDATVMPIARFIGLDTMDFASKVVEHVTHLATMGLRSIIFVDGGGVGGGVVDRLRQLGYDPVDVNFGSSPSDERKYLNRRAEMWDRMREWLPIGSLLPDEPLAVDLTGVEYGYTPKNQIQLESKKEMKARGLASPDAADALALTFAQTINFNPGANAPPTTGARKTTVRGHDPMQLVYN